MMEGSVTLETQLAWARDNPAHAIALRVSMCESADEILVELENGLDWAIGRLVASRKHYQGTSEDLRTVHIIDILQTMGFPARHDEENGGHADISIRMRDNFLWIGEAKNWNGAAYIHGGFNQLMTRYVSGLKNQTFGGILIYSENRDVPALMEKWRDFLKENEEACAEPIIIDGLSFRSSHPHMTTKARIDVKHLAVPLLWDPI